MSDFKNNSDLLNLLLKYWKQLATVAFVALILSAVFSSPWVITPKFKSFAVLYPANIIPMGSETATEQMLQVLESDEIRDSLAAAYNLYDWYGIDPEYKSAKSAFINEYQGNVTFRKTEYESVVIEVLDESPLQAKEMVQSIIYYFNRKQRSLQKEKAQEVVKILSTQVARKKAEMDSMETILTDIRQNYGILDYALQTEYATERYLEVISTPSKRANAKEIEPLLEALKEKGGEFMAISEHLWRVRGSYNDLKEQLEEAQRDVEKDLTYSNIIINPVESDKKAYPVRWLIVAASVLGTLLLAILVVGIIENLKQPATTS